MGLREFRGGVFAASLPEGRAGATLFVQPEGLTARTDDGQQFLLPYSDMAIELGGASGQMLFCHDSGRSVTLFCDERGFMFALTSEGGGHMGQKLAPVRGRLARQRMVRWAIGVATVTALLALLVALPPLVRSGIRAAVNAVPFSVDEKLGEQAIQSMDLGGPPLRDPTVTAALNAIVARLTTALPKHISVTVVQRDVANAFALPGGHVVIYTGLLTRAPQPEHVAAVLAHEIQHVLLRHGLQRIAQSLGIVATIQFMFGDVGGTLALGKELLTVMAINSYSRADESHADRQAIRLLYDTHLDPLALPAFLKILQDDESPVAGTIPTWISTHPELAHRIADLTAWVRELQTQAPADTLKPLPVDWAAVQQRLATAAPTQGRP